MTPLFLDVETIGFHSFVVLIQYAEGDGEIVLYDVWKEPVSKTLALIEKIYSSNIVGFNLTFDLYHLVKCYNCFRLVKNKDLPPDIDEVYSLQAEARDGLCLKPKHILDLFLHARKGPYQNLMDRKDIRIKRIPDILAWDLVKELEKRVVLNPIFFARKKDKTVWQVENTMVDGESLPGFADIVLRFAPSSGLKALAIDALKLENVDTFDDVIFTTKQPLIEYGYDPCHGNWNELIDQHILHWRYNGRARKYAENDIDYTRRLYYHFGKPAFDDHDSILAGLVPTVRWKGFRVNVAKLAALMEANLAIVNSAPKAPNYVKRWLFEVLDRNEQAAVKDTSKNTLKEIEKWEKDGQPHPAAIRAKAVLAARGAEKENSLYEKLIQAGRFHPSFKVIGALSGRMAGADDLNAQGINKNKKVRACFELAFEDEFLCIGDFDAFEASLAAAAYNDPKLTERLMSGKKIGGLMAEMMFPDEDYDEIMASEGTENDHYKLGKNGFFASVYFGDENTLANKYNIPLEIGKPGLEAFREEYEGVVAAQARTIAKFASVKQPGGIGTKVIWSEPAEYVESLFGFRRYFTLENKIVKALYQLAQDPPEHFKRFNHVKVKRRDRLQTPGGALMSALYGCLMQIQAAVVRAAGNHEIQSSGAQITKHLQVNLWELQPCGIGPWKIRLMQVHDEVPSATSDPVIKELTKEVVSKLLESYRSRVPLIGMKWKVDQPNWAGKVM